MARKRKDDWVGLVAAIYEAGIDPSLWNVAMQAVADRLGTQGYVLASTDLDYLRDHPPVIRPDMEEAYRNQLARFPGAAHQMLDAARKLRPRPGMVVTGNQLVPVSTFRNSPVYTEYFVPLEVDQQLILFLDTHRTRDIDFDHATLTRDARQPEFDESDRRGLAALFPHLRRALDLNARLEAQRNLARAALEALDRLPTGMLLIAANGAVLHTNAAAEQMLRCNDGIALRQGRLGCADLRVTARLHGLIAEAVHAFGLDPPASGGAILLPRPSGLPPWQAIVSPLAPGNPYALGPAHAAALVMLSDPAAAVRAPDARLAALFGFTPAESRVALALANGLAPAEIAERQQTSLFTVRTHIRRLHEKLGVRSQGQLMRRLLASGNVYAEPARE